MATVRDVPEQPGEAREHPPRAQREPRYGQPFFPVVPFGASLYILATAIALVWLALSSPAPLQHPADPLNHEKINPRPEWYFLFLFQILKIFQGPLEIVGTAQWQTASSQYPATVLAQPTWTDIHAIFAKNCRPCHIATSSGGLSLD